MGDMSSPDPARIAEPLFLILWPGQEPCPRCWATGVEPSVVTMDRAACELCKGAGKVYVSAALAGGSR